MKVSVINNSKHELPSYATKGSAGMDLRANIDSPIVLSPGERALVKTGIHIALPEGYEARIQTRSGMALKHGIMVLNSPGCIDCDYRGEIGVILINVGERCFIVNDGDKVAQMIVSAYKRVEWEPVTSLDETERGEGGFGHTGI